MNGQIDKLRHIYGVKAEDKVNGSKRNDTDLPSSKYSIPNGRATGNIDQVYIKNGVKYNVSITYINGNISSVNVKPIESSLTVK